MKVIEKLILKDPNTGNKLEILGPSHPLINTIQSNLGEDIKFYNSFLSSCLTTFSRPFFIDEIVYKE